jgi:uncharacterized RDD family membrane protein YckC
MYSEIIAKKRDRMLAFAVDCVVMLAVFVVLVVLFNKDGEVQKEHYINKLPLAILNISFLIIWPISEAFFGQTIGKRLVGLKVVSESFGTIRKRQAIIRFLFGYLDMLFFCLGLIVAANNKKNQRIGDLVAKTLVVDLNKSNVTNK